MGLWSCASRWRTRCRPSTAAIAGLFALVALVYMSNYASMISKRAALKGAVHLTQPSDVPQKSAESIVESRVDDERAAPIPPVWPGPASGRLCNNLFHLAMSAHEAKRSGRDLLIAGEWYTILFGVIDLDLLRSYLEPSSTLVLSATPLDQATTRPILEEPMDATWCAIPHTWTSLRRYIRPHESLRAQAEEDVRNLRASLSDERDVMSVHLRLFERNQLAAEWPLTLPKWLNGSRRLALYLSDDSGTPAATKSFSELRSPDTGFLPAVQVKSNSGSMIRDMWASVLADYYVGSPYSSCEGIVAMWRAERGLPRETVYPSSCLAEYSRVDDEPSDLSEACGHTRYLTLESDDKIVLNRCDRVKILASAVAKARLGKLGLILWGAWRELVEAAGGVESLARAGLDVPIRLAREPKWQRRIVFPSEWFYPSLVPKQELEGCAMNASTSTSSPAAWTARLGCPLAEDALVPQSILYLQSGRRPRDAYWSCGTKVDRRKLQRYGDAW